MINPELEEKIGKILEFHHFIESELPQNFYLDVPVADFIKVRDLGCYFENGRFFVKSDNKNLDYILKTWKTVQFA